MNQHLDCRALLAVMRLLRVARNDGWCVPRNDTLPVIASEARQSTAHLFTCNPMDKHQ
jgi:hypothetical protein